MNLNEFSQAKSEFSHVVRMVKNHIAEDFISKFILSVSNLHERLPMDRFDVKCQNMEIHFISMLQSRQAVGAYPKLYSAY